MKTESPDKIGECRLCLKHLPLCMSHVVSEFLHAEMYDDKHRFLELKSLEIGPPKMKQKGYRERLLCRSCEAVLNEYEKHSRRLFTDALPPLREIGTGRHFPRLDHKKLKLFFLSILWRVAVSQGSGDSVKLPDGGEEIRKRLLSADAGLPHEFQTCLFTVFEDGIHFRDMLTEVTRSELDPNQYFMFLAGFVIVIRQMGEPGSHHPRLAQETGVVAFDTEFGQWPFLRTIRQFLKETAWRLSPQCIPDNDESWTASLRDDDALQIALLTHQSGAASGTGSYQGLSSGC